MKHSIPNLTHLPPVRQLKQKLQSLAMLDAILMAEWEQRFFSFNSHWSQNEMMASMRDGEGSDFYFLFDTNGAAGKIYCKGYSLKENLASVLNTVPREFSSFLGEAAFSIDVATCYLWQRGGDISWSVAPVENPELPLLAFVTDEGEYYHGWAKEYYGLNPALDSIKAVFKQQSLTKELLNSLNAEVEMGSILLDVQEIGYPH